MAGNGHSLVRPKQGEQDTSKILAGSPLAVQGVFLEILRERFIEGSGLDLVWRPDMTLTDILIETDYNEELESRSQTPAAYVGRLQTVPSKQMIGDRAGVRLPDHLEGQSALTTIQLNVDCVSNDNGESAVLGDLIQFMLLASQDVIQREFGFYDMSHPVLGQTIPFEQNVTKWNTPVSFVVQFWIRWAQVPIAPLLQQVAQRVTSKGIDATGHFVDIAVNSIKRGEVLKLDSIDPTKPLPASRVSVVGPPGPPGPPGPQGPPGVAVNVLPDATEIGQVVMSLDGSTWSATLPVVSGADGWLSNADGALLVEGLEP